MKILITGGNGFIARSLNESISKYYEVHCLSRKELDLNNREAVHKLLKAGNFDIVIHTANYDAAHKFFNNDKNLVMYNNLKMFNNIVENKDYFGKMIYFGSSAEFDRNYWKLDMTEEYCGEHVPEDQYGLSKFIMNHTARNTKGIYNLRLFGVYGKYDDYRYRFIPNVIFNAVNNNPIVINQNKTMGFMYIDELITIIEYFTRSDLTHSDYNICNPYPRKLNAMAQSILSILNKDLPISVVEETNIEYSGDILRLINEIGYVKRTLFEYAVKEIAEYYKEVLKI